MARRLAPEASEAEQLSLAGAPTDLEGLRAHLLERFGLRLTVKDLKALAEVTPAMLTPPAERQVGKKGQRR